MPDTLPPERSAAVPETLVEALCTRGLVGCGDEWVALSGGRTNRVWKIRRSTGSLVCKLYAPDGGTPLFPNDAGAEETALQALRGTGLAPRLRLAANTAAGHVLIYEFLQGTSAAPDPEAIGAMLGGLHAMPAPMGLRRLRPGAEAILRQGDAMLRGLSGTRVQELRALRPSPVATGFITPRFLHGDPVPANIIATSAGLRLIDWQCPALGDPVEDLALALSPAMQRLYGGQAMSATQCESLLAAYDHPARVARLRALLPAFHWRMAAYCLWKVARGDADYLDGFVLESARLQRPAQQQSDRHQTTAERHETQRGPDP